MARIVQVGETGNLVRFDSPPDWGVAGGGSTYETRDRPKDVSAVVFTGRQPWSASFPMVVGDGSDGVESEWALLYRTFRKPDVKLRVVAGTWPLPDRRFVLTDIQAGDLEELRGREGRRTRFEVVVTLLEYVTADVLGAQRDRERDVASTYRVRLGETLITIAARLLGDPARWVQIAALNPKWRDPRRVPVGTVLVIPVK